MEWKMEKKGLLNREVTLPERSCAAGEATSVLLSVDEYDGMLEAIKRLQQQIKKTDNQMRSIKSECTKKINRMERETEELRKGLQEESEEIVRNANRERDEAIELNRNLLRINKERSNSDRGLKNVKKCPGYVVTQTRQVAIRITKNNRVNEVTVWETTIQTPYSADFPLMQVERLVLQELSGENGLLSKLGIKERQIKDYRSFLREDRTSDGLTGQQYLESNNVIFKECYRLNVKVGYWDLIYLHNKPLGLIPMEMRP